MTSPQHQAWINAGSHWRAAVPIAEYQHALTVVLGAPADSIGTIGDASHLDAEPPEDHTPYSETGWPVATPGGVVTAIDYQGPGWENWARYVIAEANAGRAPWVKYVNYNGIHYSWEPSPAQRPSSDWTGHVHVSIRSDWCDRSTGLPVAQLAGTVTLPAPTPGPGPVSDALREAIMSSWQTVRQGSTGQNVKDVQALLNAHGAGLSVDGIDGPLTTAAVAQFQAQHHVPNSVRADGSGDGIAGPQTLIALLDM